MLSYAAFLPSLKNQCLVCQTPADVHPDTAPHEILSLTCGAYGTSHAYSLGTMDPLVKIVTRISSFLYQQSGHTVYVVSVENKVLWLSPRLSLAPLSYFLDTNAFQLDHKVAFGLGRHVSQNRSSAFAAMASATDIITYIGVPLAVLGTLPILYTFFLAFVTRNRIRSALLRHGHRPETTRNRQDGFAIRGSPMTSVIEVELPRYTIAPLDRNHREYWELSYDGEAQAQEHSHLLHRAESTLSMIEEGRVRGFLRGGSWRAFNWKRLPIGKKMYRIQYEDELREPPAEINFSDLIHFLMDRGAVADRAGWEKLRISGLWTPSGTVLLALSVQENSEGKPDAGSSWVLRTGTPDESDGVLSLCVRWPATLESHGASRDACSLPPGWERLMQPHDQDIDEDVSKNKDEASDESDTKKKYLPSLIAKAKACLMVDSANLESNSVRFRAEDGQITQISWENQFAENGVVTNVSHLGREQHGISWFTSAIIASLSNQPRHLSLWGVRIPQDLIDIVTRDSVPCGVLVLLGLLDEENAPEWTVPHDARAENDRALRRMMARNESQMAARRLEATMTPEQAAVHRTNRFAQERRDDMENLQSSMKERHARLERRDRDAVVSSKISNKSVASHAMKWLARNGYVGKNWNLDQIAQSAIFLLAVDQAEDGQGRRIIQMLAEWETWTMTGGMKMEQLDQLKSRVSEFCLAACMIASILEAVQNTAGQTGFDMLECLKSWRNVRLG